MYLKASTISVDDALPQDLVEQSGQSTQQALHSRRTALVQSPVAPWGSRSTALPSKKTGRSDQAPTTHGSSQSRLLDARHGAKLLDGFKLLKLAGVSLPEDARSATCVGERFAGVESADLPFFTSLERLVLNECTGLRLEMFALLPSLETLSLSACGLVDTGSLAHESFPQLRELHVSHNRLSSASIRAIGRLPRLEKLDLSSNSLSQVPQELSQCSSLVELSLSRNQLTDESNAWSVVAFLPNLQRLNLSHNYLSRVPLGLEQPRSPASEGGATTSADSPDAFPRLQWLNMASNNVQHDDVVAALLSYAANLRQLILFDNPIAKPLLPSELKEQRFNDPKQIQLSRESAVGDSGASAEPQGPAAPRVVNVVTDGNAATAGMAAADDATRSASIGVGMLKGTRRAAAQRAAVHSAALSAAQVVEGSVRPGERQRLLNGSAPVPQGMAALDAALGANIGAAYTALRHRRGGSLFAVSDDARRLRSAREALGGLTLKSSRKEKLHSALHGDGKTKSKFASETQASLSRSAGLGSRASARRRPDGSRAALESPAARRALQAAGKLAQLGNAPQSLVRARRELGARSGSARHAHRSALLPAVSAATVTDDDIAAVAATLVTHEEPAVPVRLAAALNALRHAVQQPSGDDARMAQLMAQAAASRTAAQRRRT